MRPFRCPVTILNTLDHLGSGPTCIFDIDILTKSMNSKPVVAGNQSNSNAGTKENIDASQAGKKTVPDQEYILLPLWAFDPLLSQGPKNIEVPEKESGVSSKEDDNQDLRDEFERLIQHEKNGENDVNIYGCDDDPNMPNLEEIVYLDDDEDVGAEADMTNLDTNIPVSPISTTKIHKVHPIEQIIRDIHSSPQTRRMTKSMTDHEPKKVIKALTDLSWIESMQDELLQFNLQQVWILVDLPYGKRSIRTKWIYRNKKDERGIVVRNKMDMKSAFLYGKIKEEVLCIEFEKPMHKKFQMSSMGELTYFLGLTPMETSKPIMKDEIVEDVDVHLYRSMIRSLMYLTSSRPDIIFVDSPFDLEAYTDSDYVGASLDRKSTTRGYQFLGCRLISWQCKKQTVVVNSTTEAEYIAASNCCGQIIHKGWLNWNAKAAMDEIRVKTDFNDEYDTPSHTKKVFANMRRQGKDFSRRVTPLFETMLIQHPAGVGEGSGEPTYPQHTSTSTQPFHEESITIPSSSQPKKTKKHRKTKSKATEISQSSGLTTLVADETVHEKRRDIVKRAATTASSLEAEQDSGSGLRRQDTTLGDIPAQTRIESSTEKSLGDQEDASNQRRNIANFDQNEGISFVQEDAETQGRYGPNIEVNTASTSITTASINITTVEPVTTVSAPATTAGVSLKSKSFEEVQKAFNKTMSWINLFVLMDLEVVKGSGKKAKSSRKEAVSKKRARKGLDEESVKRQKLEDDTKKEELKACLKIVSNDDKIINIEPLAIKSLTVD
uniref:Reverse transcriptase Ty1/copia-type domain-containing protein n=1 Tax=Tanacetum cinerariifolium TaxID=118510 RepID=A0A6L2LXR3_TANCI|nr:hypothetical protein [Tanacetum cinerariifolium]